MQCKFGDLFSLQAMSRNGSVAFDHLRVQKACEANGRVMKGCNSLEFGPEKYQAKTRLMQDLSRIKPQMILKLLSSNKQFEDKKVDFAHVNREGHGLNRLSEASTHAEIMELFPLSPGFGPNPRVTEANVTFPSEISLANPNSSGCVVAEAPEKPSTSQLPIFYNGVLNAYDIPAQKIQDIMKLASGNSWSNIRTSKISSGKIEHTSGRQPSKSSFNAVNENQPQRLAAGLGIVKKLSLQRFLQKRKERLSSVGPYNTVETATLPRKAAKDSDEQIILSLGCQ